MRKFLTVYICLILCLLTGCRKTPAWADHAKTELTVAFIDVGKGDCIVIAGGDHVIMIDCGYEDTVKAVKADLSDLRIDHIDEMIITHYDKDHYGGAAGLLHTYPAKTVYIPDYLPEGEKYEDVMEDLEDSGANLVRVREQIKIAFPIGEQEAELTILPSFVSYDAAEKNDNDMSLVEALHYGADSFLFTGDIERESIEAFIPVAEHYDILKFPHHGDWKKNTESLLEKIDPKEVIITDGDDRPIEEKTEAYLTGAAIPYYTTKENGSIVVFCTGSGTYEVVCGK